MIRQLMTVAGLLAATGGACADTGTITFSGTVAATCALTVSPGAGVLKPSATLDSMSSRNAGGVSGTVSVTTTGDVNFAIDPATAPVQPAADTATTNWVPTYRMSGAQTVADTSGTTRLTATGTSNVVVDLTGTKTGTSTFKPGTYGATVTVRCAP